MSTQGLRQLSRRMCLLAGMFAAVFIWMYSPSGRIYELSRTSAERMKDAPMVVSGDAFTALLTGIHSGTGVWSGLALQERKARRPAFEPVYLFRSGELAFLDNLVVSGLDAGGSLEQGPHYLALGKTSNNPVELRVHGSRGVDRGRGPFPTLSAPGAVLRPYRNYALLPLVLGTVVFFLVGTGRAREGEEHYSARKVLMVTDVLYALFATAPFGIASLLAGSSLTALTEGIALTAFFLGLSCFWIAALVLNAHYASVTVAFVPDGIYHSTFGSCHCIPYAEMASVSGAWKCAPRWLHWVYTLGSFLGRPGQRSLAAANLSNVGTFRKTGFQVFLKDGSSEDLWLTDATGAPLLAGHEKLVARLAERLRSEGIEVLPAAKQAMGAP